MYRCVTLHQNVITCSYCNVYITHTFCKASLIPLKHDNICFIKNCFKNVAWKFMYILNSCTFYLYKIYLGLNKKNVYSLSPFS